MVFEWVVIHKDHPLWSLCSSRRLYNLAGINLPQRTSQHITINSFNVLSCAMITLNILDVWNTNVKPQSCWIVIDERKKETKTFFSCLFSCFARTSPTWFSCWWSSVERFKYGSVHLFYVHFLFMPKEEVPVHVTKAFPWKQICQLHLDVALFTSASSSADKTFISQKDQK